MLIIPGMVKTIALFGLSANPPSGDSGHVGIVRALVQTGRFNEIWVLPVYQHMYSSKRNLEAYDHRMEMCRLSFVPESSPTCQVSIKNIEKEAFLDACAAKPDVDAANIRMGTIDIIKYINKQHQQSTSADAKEELKLSFVLGSDTFRDLMAGKWKDSLGVNSAPSIVSSVTMEVFTRKDSDDNDNADNSGKNDKGHDSDKNSVKGKESYRKSARESIQDIVDTSSADLQAKAVFHIHDVPWLGSVSSTAIRTWNPPSPVTRILTGITKILPPPIRPKVTWWRSGPTELTREWIHPDALEYIKAHELFFYSKEAQQLRSRKAASRHLTVLAVAVALAIAWQVPVRSSLPTFLKR